MGKVFNFIAARKSSRNHRGNGPDVAHEAYVGQPCSRYCMFCSLSCLTEQRAIVLFQPFFCRLICHVIDHDRQRKERGNSRIKGFRSTWTIRVPSNTMSNNFACMTHIYIARYVVWFNKPARIFQSPLILPAMKGDQRWKLQLTFVRCNFANCKSSNYNKSHGFNQRGHRGRSGLGEGQVGILVTWSLFHAIDLKKIRGLL